MPLLRSKEPGVYDPFWGKAMGDESIEEFARLFYRVFYDRQTGAMPSRRLESLSIDDAYAVQHRVVELRVANGERPIGYKVGCTSRAIRQQFGLHEPIYGRLLEPHIYPDGATLDLGRFTSCALEPEFVLTIGRDIMDEESDDFALINAIEHISPGLEIHNYKFWFGTPTLQELIASNGIHAGLVIGSAKVQPASIDLRETVASIFVDDTVIASGKGSEILDGGPLASLRFLVKHLASRSNYLRAGDVVIPGSPVQLVPIAARQTARAVLSGVGSVSARFV
jgi:2-keto-4-pentenoate hydratase